MPGKVLLTAPARSVVRAAGSVSIFGWLDNVPVWNQLPYPWKGAILRALKAGLSVLVAGLLAAAVAGTLFPPAWGVPSFVVAAIAIPALQAADKFIREWNIQDDGGNPPPTDNPPVEEPPAPPTDVEVTDNPPIEDVPEDTIP